MLSRQFGVARPSARRRMVALISAFGIGIALAAPGDLDTGFGDNGILSLTIEGSTSEAYSVVQQADGKLVLAGTTSDTVPNVDFVVVRLAADGTRDTTFGVDGVAKADFNGTDDYANAVIQQSDGKLVLVGGAVANTSNTQDITVARFNADGSSDVTFGGVGHVILDIDVIDYASDVIQQADGKLVIVGTTNSTTTDWPGTARALFARFNADGSLDTSFGSGGTTLVDFGGGLASTAASLAVQGDGKLVAVGLVLGENSVDMGLMRLTADGVLDPLFDGDGMVAVDFNGNADVANAVAIQPDGAIVVAGYSEPTDGSGIFESALLRVAGDGSLDSTFGDGGKSVVDLGGRRSRIDSIVVLPDNSLAATGTRNTSETGFDFGDDMILAHLNSNGTLDLNYADEGVATADFGNGNVAPFSQGVALIQQADGKLVAVGPTAFDGAISAARFDDGASYAGRIGLTNTSQSVDEDTVTSVTYTVRRTGGKTGPISVDYATVAGSAQPGTDFVSAASETLDWNDGDASDRSITIDLVDDEPLEGLENFSLVLATPTGGARLAASEATTYIQDGVRVPNVINQTELSATITLTESGFTVGTVTRQTSSVAVGSVISQSPSAGTFSSIGAAVDLVISSGGGGGGGGGGGAFGAWSLVFLAGFVFAGNVQRRRKYLCKPESKLA